MHLPPVGHVAVATGVDKHTSLRLYTLTLCVFAIGVAEFLLVGLLPKVASGVGVSVSEAGSLVTAYALAIAIGSPLLIVAVGRFDTRWALVGLMGLFSVGNLIVGLSPALLRPARRPYFFGRRSRSCRRDRCVDRRFACARRTRRPRGCNRVARPHRGYGPRRSSRQCSRRGHWVARHLPCGR